MEYEFYTADVFTNRLFEGAQIAVFPNAEGLGEARMQQISNEFNLSETVFVFASGDDKTKRRMKVFSGFGEKDFAGHPVIATAYVLAETGNISLNGHSNPIVLEQNAGEINTNISVEDGKVKLVQFSLKPEPIIDRFVPRDQELAECLSLPIDAIENKKYHTLMVSCGFPYLIIPLTSYQAVRKATFNYSAWGQTTAPATSAQELLLFASQSVDTTAEFHGRLVGPHIGINEDPPIGSSIPAFTSYLCAHSHIRTGTYTFAIDRGTDSGRRSLIHIEMDNRGNNQLTVRVGGEAVMVSHGKINVPDPD